MEHMGTTEVNNDPTCRYTLEPEQDVDMDCPIDLRPPVQLSKAKQHHTRDDLKGMHISHFLHRVQDVTFCARCGYWCQLKSEKLREMCPGVTPNNNNQSSLNRMLTGRHPRRLDTWPDGASAKARYEVVRVDG